MHNKILGFIIYLGIYVYAPFGRGNFNAHQIGRGYLDARQLDPYHSSTCVNLTVHLGESQLSA